MMKKTQNNSATNRAGNEDVFERDCDTIAGISTATGGGIGIVRLSGGQSLEIIKRLFKPASKITRKLESHRVYYGKIIWNGAALDEVLITVMLAPKSYTREDVAEINCHGGNASLSLILEAVLNCGARLAEPGEFTKRAFMNGRLDLAQAEAVMDIISSKSVQAHKAALCQLEGGLSAEIRECGILLLEEIAKIEAAIDYPEEFENSVERLDSLREALTKILTRLKKLSSTKNTGRLIKEGLKTVISGKPNVGKSSLLNAILGYERAIVTNIPGTTRDLLTESVRIGTSANVLLCLHDTAGIRDYQSNRVDEVEQIGINLSVKAIKDADLVLFVVDGSEPIAEDDLKILEDIKITGVPFICVVNKADLQTKENLRSGYVIDCEIKIHVSAKTRLGIDKLNKSIEEMFFGGAISEKSNAEEIIVTNLRHTESIDEAVKNIEAALTATSAGLPEDLISIDLTAAYTNLCEITGENVRENIVETIFSKFCLGK